MTIETLEEERDKIMLQNLIDVPVDYTNLRKICKEYSAITDIVFALNGTDEELWNSVNTYFRSLLPKKTTS